MSVSVEEGWAILVPETAFLGVLADPFRASVTCSRSADGISCPCLV